MWKKRIVGGLLTGAMVAAPLTGLTGCEDLPGEPETQGAVIGGLGGAAAGAALGGENRLLGALIGGALGAGGGYLIGANIDDFDDEDEAEVRSEAERAAERARRNPATPQDVYDSTTADLNNDGFVTTDEIIAMEEAGLDDDQIIDRLEATDQVFDLSPQQEDYLLANGVSRNVVQTLPRINQAERDEFLRERESRRQQGDVIGREREMDTYEAWPYLD